jgi:hypothetical protein
MSQGNFSDDRLRGSAFQTPERLRDLAGRLEPQKPDEDSLTLTQLLRKVDAALAT